MESQQQSLRGNLSTDMIQMSANSLQNAFFSTRGDLKLFRKVYDDTIMSYPI